MKTKAKGKRLKPVAVWILRILIGATFIISGVAKMIDPYGFIYKISDYLAVWHITMPEGIVILGAVSISIVEFMVGFMLATGSYRRSSPLIGTLIMAFMLPLSLYLVIANPVEHCGCFGDFLVISHLSTFFKNIALMAGLLWLVSNNRIITGPFHWYVQWIQAAVAFIYICVIGLIGYHEQPLIDFRPYKIGTRLVEQQSDADSDNIKFVYAKDGREETFSIDNLPDDTWTFVTRIESEADENASNTFSITDVNGNEVTDEAIRNNGEELVVLIPELSHPDISLSYVVNELNSYIKKRGGSLIVIGNGNAEDREEWMDLSMADYPVYFGEDTTIKTIARGKISVVYLQDGIIKWKRTLSSVNLDRLSKDTDSRYSLDRLATEGPKWFTILTVIFIGLELFVWTLGTGLHIIHQKKIRIYKDSCDVQ